MKYEKWSLYFLIFEFICITVIGAICALGLNIDGAGVISYMSFFCAFLCGIMLGDIYYQERKANKKC